MTGREMTQLFTEYTWQDYCASTDRERMLLEAVERYKLHPDFTHALEADAYFRGESHCLRGPCYLT